MEKDREIITNIRKNILKMMRYSKSSHIGACFSCVEVIYALHFKVMNCASYCINNGDNDRFILSKAHASVALYSVLAEKGYIPRRWLEEFYIDGGTLPGHLDNTVSPWVSLSGGSLGHGLSVGLGIALAIKKQNKAGRVFTLLGDGECNEGSVWEAIMLAGHLKLSNLVAIVDFNEYQAFGRTNDVINQYNLVNRWNSFGWDVFEIDGHSVEQLVNVVSENTSNPQVIIAHTVKGKGVSFMENKLEWHYKSPNEQEYELALKELDGVQ